jgi:23S rRNA (uracil1939-C5)-methyltransferase
VGKVLDEMKNAVPDLVMLDPPRAGLDSKAMQRLKELKPLSILYISCNPVTQAANSQEFISAGYQLEAVQPVDQFPQTLHVENIALLKKS